MEGHDSNDSSTLLSARRTLAEEALRNAISNLQKSIAKDPGHQFSDRQFPTLPDNLSIEDRAEFLASTISNVFDSLAVRTSTKDFLVR